MIGRCVAVMAALGLVGCAGGPGVEATPPPDAKAIILAHKARLWKDPDSIRNASIAPTPRWQVHGAIWSICVELNAKNSFGGYTGLKQSIVLIYVSGAPPEVRNAVFGDDCANLAPFPELEGDQGRPAPAAKPTAKR